MRPGSLLKASFCLCAALLLSPFAARAQNDSTKQRGPVFELYGRLTTNIIHDFNQINPDWFDVLRPSKLPAFEDEFGDDHHTYFSVRPTRFGVKPTFPTSLGDIKGIFEFDIFGVGRDAGRTAFHLQFAYVELGRFGVGQYYSPFMEIDVFPNSLEYWGPVGIVYFQNIQFRYMPMRGDSRVTVALERPGASKDRGDNDDFRVDFAGLRERFPWPDLSAEGRLGGDWGFVKLGGVLKGIYWDDLFPDNPVDLDGSALGWGLSLSSALHTTPRDRLKLQVTYGEAIQNYLDAPFDIGIEVNPGSVFRPFEGVALPVFAMLAFYDHHWGSRFSTTLGYSRVDVDNSNGQGSLAFQSGQYALINLLYHPVTNLRVGGEFQWGHRANAFDDFDVSDFRLQFQARYSYSFLLGDQPVADNGREK